MKMKTVYLTDVANIEKRPTINKIYPVGTIIIQISATKGQVLFLREPSLIENHYAVISAKENIHPFYLFSVIEKFFPAFFRKYKQGLNFKAEVLDDFTFLIHQEEKQQAQIGKLMMCCGASSEVFYQHPTLNQGSDSA